MSESVIKPATRRRYDAVRAVDPKLGTVSRAKAEELCRTGGKESSGRGEYLWGRDLKAVRTPAFGSPAPKYWETFHRTVKPLGWGPGYHGGKLDLSARPVRMGYGFALLGKGQGAVFGVPEIGDFAFVLRDSESGISAAGRLPRPIDRKGACGFIREFCEMIYLNRGYNLKTLSPMEKFFRGVANGESFDPYDFEMKRLAAEFIGLRINAERLDGGIVSFADGSGRRSNGRHGTKALAGAAAAAGISFAQSSVVPLSGNGAMLEFIPASQALVLGGTSILALGLQM